MFNYKKTLISPTGKGGKNEKKKCFGYDIYTEIGSRYRSFARTGSQFSHRNLIARFDFLCQNTIYSPRIRHLPIFSTLSRAQASKALGVCESKNEFEGSYERVEFERLLIEAHHKHKYASDEINRLKNMMARGQLDAFKGNQDFKKKHFFSFFVCAAYAISRFF